MYTSNEDYDYDIIIGIALGVLGIITVSVGNISNPEFSGIVFVGYLMLLLYACSKGKVFLKFYYLPLQLFQLLLAYMEV